MTELEWLNHREHGDTETGLVVQNLSVSFDQPVIRGVNLRVDEGEILSLVGPSGSGKTTLLRTIAGLHSHAGGRILVNGRDISDEQPQHRKTGLVFQTPTLFPDLTVRENIAFGLDDAMMSDSRRDDLVEIGMTMMNIAELAELRPDVLSGGQGQRVSFARTIVRRPRVLLLDEPVAHVEVALRHAIHKDITTQVRRMGMNAIYVTHDISEACALGDRIAIMNSGQIVQEGTPRWVYQHPHSAFVAELMGVVNGFAARAINRTGDLAHVRLGKATLSLPCQDSVVKGPVTVFVPPESVDLSDAPQREGFMLGQVIEAGFARTHMVYDIETDFGTLVAHDSTQKAPRQIGERVWFRVRDGWVIPSEG